MDAQAATALEEAAGVVEILGGVDRLPFVSTGVKHLSCALINDMNDESSSFDYFLEIG